MPDNFKTDPIAAHHAPGERAVTGPEYGTEDIITGYEEVYEDLEKPQRESVESTFAEFAPDEEGASHRLQGSGPHARARRRMYEQFRGYYPGKGMKSDSSDRQMERAMRQYFHGQGVDKYGNRRRSYEDVLNSFLKEEMAEEARKEQVESKYKSEMQEYNVRRLLRQRLESSIRGMEGLGAAGESAIRKRFSEKRAGMGAAFVGAPSGTARAGFEAKLAAEEEAALSAHQESVRRERMGYETMLTGDLANSFFNIEHRGPSTESMWNMMFQAGQSGAGSGVQPQGGQTGKGASSGAALGIGAALAFAFCCWIFMAVYGPELDEIVRRYRDEKMTPRNRRGYYKMSDVIVPLMMRHPWFKSVVRYTICEPLIAYGRWYYRNEVKRPSIWRHIGFLWKPVEMFWMATWNVLGGEVNYVRANGELVK
tara:strand:+ start:2609 stop:3880 length:1272 start_codon:yes stop_codon:yes gene_type:complete